MASIFKGPVVPAPYGRACVGCSRAKCKCFYRTEGTSCERCYRLRKYCEQAPNVRKRKAAEQHSQQYSPPAPSCPSQIENKLYDPMALTRAQGGGSDNSIPHHEPNGGSSMPLLTASEADVESTPHTLPSPSVHDPGLTIDMNTNVVHLLRSSSSDIATSLVAEDVAVFKSISEQAAEENLQTFQQSFISMFPFVHINVGAVELRERKPFLWLVIMSLSTKLVSQQFLIEEIIWHVISKRIVVQHLANLDLLLGVICFASWSHYFKKEKPFMTMLSQLAVSIALELNIHQGTPSSGQLRRGTSSQLRAQRQPSAQERTLEERRTMLALFHLTSSSWMAYRKTEPLRWTPYMNECLSILYKGAETEMDIMLAMQVKCQIITNQLTCHHVDDELEVEMSSMSMSTLLVKTLLERIGNIRQSCPSQIRLHRTTQFYLLNAELTARGAALRGQKVASGNNLYRRVHTLESLLNTVEQWIDLFCAMPFSNWMGITVDHFAQFLFALVVLFRLTTLTESGWDNDQVRQRLDVLDVLDRCCSTIDQIPSALGIVDAEGPRSGLLFKTTYLLRAIKTLFQTELGQVKQANEKRAQSSGSGSGVGGDGTDNGLGIDTNMLVIDNFLMNLGDEPWMSDILWTSWDVQ